jgi:membrane protein YdbS with pleckstrin-like domain
MGIFNFLALSYSQLITEDSQGNQTILYDVNNTQMTKTIVAFFAVIVFAAVVVLIILAQFVKFRKR